MLSFEKTKRLPDFKISESFNPYQIQKASVKRGKKHPPQIICFCPPFTNGIRCFQCRSCSNLLAVRPGQRKPRRVSANVGILNETFCGIFTLVLTITSLLIAETKWKIQCNLDGITHGKFQCFIIFCYTLSILRIPRLNN